MKNKIKTPDVYIKNVKIQLKNNFTFDNLPHSEGKSNKPFIGREELMNKFIEMLKRERGVYLVTGYRGMGKTSFVNQVISRYNKRTSKKLKSVKITITHNNPTEIEILRLMVSTLSDELPRLFWFKVFKLMKVFFGSLWKILLLVFISIFFLFLLKNDKNEFVNFFTFKYPESLRRFFANDDCLWCIGEQCIIKNIFIKYFDKVDRIETNIKLFAFLIILFSIVSFFIYLYFEHVNSYNKILNRLEILLKRSHSSVSYENAGVNEIAFEAVNAKITQGGNKMIENYPIASSKEIEYDLTKVINEIPKRYKFIFIFDELDKVEPVSMSKLGDNNSSLSYESTTPEKAYLEQLRERKRIIQQVIAGLKNFFTVTDAPFIFIAGREMFEASMADIADRQSSISSIFSYVFYIESLLKEKIIGSGSLSKGIENYLFTIINGRLPKVNESIYEQNVEKYNDLNDTVKVNLLLQNFIVYLTYRSNGSPKKLIRLIHEFVKVNKTDGVNILKRNISKNTDLDIVWSNKNKKPWNQFEKISNYISSLLSKKEFNLYFNYTQQQRIGFISYMYRPFLVKYGSSFKTYGDNLIVSTPYLFDHLLKFHPFAFSNNHLEFIPEVLSANRTPALRDHIKKIIDYLMLNHIRETEIGLFDYKFYNKTVNEIFYLSKINEEESAAFNFTLDESYLTKLHVRDKLRVLRSIYEKQIGIDSISPTLYSISYLNGVLGDLHFFDQEYDDAIIAYSDGIRALGKVKENVNEMQDFILLLKYKLKLGLTYEKIKSFEESLSLYSDATSNIKEFIESQLKYEKNDDRVIFKGRNGSNHNIRASLNDLMQVANQAFLAKMVLQEKMGVEGITAMKNSITIGGFLNLMENIARFNGTNSVIIANFFLQSGILYYLKNSSKAFEDGLNRSDIKYKSFFPYPNNIQAYYNDIDNTIVHYTLLINNNKSIFRKPIIALAFYCVGLKYLLISRINTDEDEFKSLLLISKIPQILFPNKFEKYSTSLSKVHYKYIAIFLSNIGDCLLSSMKCITNNSATFSLHEIFSEKELIKINNLINNKLHSKEEKGFSPEELIRDVLKIFIYETNISDLSPKQIFIFYLMSAYYFNMSSRHRSFSFQLRKVLYLFRLILKEADPNGKNWIVNYINGQSYDLTQIFVSFLDEIIVKTIIQTASFTSDFSDVHDYNKFTTLYGDKHINVDSEINEDNNYLQKKLSEVFKLYFDKDTSDGNKANKDILNLEQKIRNNISNFPDTKEPIILLEHIKLRLLFEVDYLKLDNAISLSSNNSVSTQYFRLIELTYAAKLYQRKIELSMLKGLKSFKGFLVQLNNNIYDPIFDDIEQKISTNENDFLKVVENSLKNFNFKSDIILKDELSKMHAAYKEDKTREERVVNDCVGYIFSLSSIVKIIDIYDNDYLVNSSFLAYHYYRMAEFFNFSEKNKNSLGVPMTLAEEAKSEILKRYSTEHHDFTSFSPLYNYSMAAKHYDRAINLHSAGQDYKIAISDTHYLEDDMNDASYHFGAAMDRYLMLNYRLSKFYYLSKKMETKFRQDDKFITV